MRRRIMHIDEEKCNGCGLCVDACHEGAIELVDGKARLVSEQYCDGLGDCLPACPTGAIEITECEAEPFDEEAVQRRMREAGEESPRVCPAGGKHSEPWPVQLALVNPDAGFLAGTHLLLAADCAAYVHSDFHREFMGDRVPLICCPKLDGRGETYVTKLASILKRQNVKSITVVRMEVPCCSGLAQLVKRSMLEAEVIVPYAEVVLSLQGEIARG
ncbi:MAG: 4Fe-4S binding protein [Bacillota bacterium]